MKNNPKLRAITLFGIRVGDNDLSICSELEHLTHLNLGYNCGFTIAGVLSVLRGRPRSTITDFCLWTEEDMVHRIDRKFDEIQAGRNVLFVKHKSFVSCQSRHRCKVHPLLSCIRNPDERRCSCLLIPLIADRHPISGGDVLSTIMIAGKAAGVIKQTISAKRLVLKHLYVLLNSNSPTCWLLMPEF
jgi:hypothetical protein